MARLARYTWWVLVYNLAVIAWGAYVRATGSGAGCGQHWPLCNGQVVVRPQSMEMLIEFSHRATSGLALITVVILFVWARRATPAGHPLRLGAGLSLGFMLSEALLGAGLVLFQLVAHDASAARAVAVAAHLLNTFLLLASLTLSAWWASGGRALDLEGRGGELTRLALNAAALLVVSCAGAITALGDTLFPSASLAEGISQDLSATAHFLIRLRTIHPVLAVMASIYMLTSVWQSAGARPLGRRLAKAITWLIVLQLVVGVTNVMLLAPVSVQLLHLLLADLVWVGYVLLAADTLATAHQPAGIGAAVARRA